MILLSMSSLQAIDHADSFATTMESDLGVDGHPDPHRPAAITISSNADFSACGWVISGNGTAANPFVIGPWAIPAPSARTSGWSVKVNNSGDLACECSHRRNGLPELRALRRRHL